MHHLLVHSCGTRCHHSGKLCRQVHSEESALEAAVCCTLISGPRLERLAVVRGAGCSRRWHMPYAVAAALPACPNLR